MATSSLLLRLSGADALPLLHRISTQALEDLALGEARATLFCDFRARLLFRAHAARLLDDSIWLVHENAPGAELAAHLDKHIFREDVKLEDLSEQFVVRGRVGGPDAGTGAVITTERRPALIDVGLATALEVVPASPGAWPDEQRYVWEVARVASGRPRHGHEIAATFHPFEVNLWDEVHLSKGCYTGQEVLQRLMTYKSVRRQLARVASRGVPPATPVPACIGDERIGTVTSAVPAGQGWAGLAVLSERAFQGLEVRVEDGPALSEVVPFESRLPRGLPEASSRPS